MAATSLPANPVKVSVEMLMDIAGALAKLDAKVEGLAASQKTIGGDIIELKRDVRYLLDWKQRIWGMVLILSVLPTLVSCIWQVASPHLP